MKRVRVIVHGRVQGVSFRYYAQRQANLFGVSGWVRNRPDGTVEAEVEGEDAAVERFMVWMRRGPSMAEVERIDVEEREPTGGEGVFSIVG